MSYEDPNGNRLLRQMYRQPEVKIACQRYSTTAWVLYTSMHEDLLIF